MFYIKEEFGDNNVIEVEITGENAYTRCALCGKEISVDLMELILDGCDIYSTSLFCGDRCFKKWRHKNALR